jgi:calmodulin
VTQSSESFLTHAHSYLDGNGTITPAELGKLMKGVLGSEIPKGEIEAIIKSVDADNSGTIDFDEFLTLMSDPKFHDPTRDESREVFEMFDKDGSGNISVSELKEAFRNLGQLIHNSHQWFNLTR